MALRWLRVHGQAAVAPMSFLTLMAEADIAAPLRSRLNALIAQTAVTREMGDGPAPVQLLAFIAADARRRSFGRRAIVRCAASSG